jgi:hypothetical protein
VKSSLEIAQEAVLRPIMDVAREMGIEEDEVDLYGKYKAKISLDVIDRLSDAPNAKIVCVSAITPTKAGEGKTTTSVSLTQGMGLIGKRPVLCLREPSLGPIFGIKGGAAGGGLTQVADGGSQLLSRRLTPSPRQTTCWRRSSITTSSTATGATSIPTASHGGRSHERPPPAQHHHGPRRSRTASRARPARHRGRLRVAIHGRWPCCGTRADRRDAVRLYTEAARRRRPTDGLRGAMTVKDALKPNLIRCWGPALLHAHRPVREHRARQQLDRRRPGRPQAGRLPDHRIRLRQ